jgi:hypothetical protein
MTSESCGSLNCLLSNSLTHVTFVYLIHETIMVILLLLRTFVSSSRSKLEIVDELQWVQAYTCTNVADALFVIQSVYYCIISIFVIGIIYKYWTAKSLEDPKW